MIGININCSERDFVALILAGDKWIETREDAWNAVEEAADPYDFIFARRSHKRNVLELDGTYVRVVKA